MRLRGAEANGIHRRYGQYLWTIGWLAMTIGFGTKILTSADDVGRMTAGVGGACVLGGLLSTKGGPKRHG